MTMGEALQCPDLWLLSTKDVDVEPSVLDTDLAQICGSLLDYLERYYHDEIACVRTGYG